MRERLLLGVLTLALVLAVLGPELAHLHQRFLGLEYVDHYGTQWFYWYVEHQLARAEGFGHTELFFYPWGKDVFAHTGSNVLDGILALPFRMLLGPVLGYNLFVLAGMAATGWAAWSLARDFSDDRLACGLGALLFTLSPYLLHDLAEGRPTQAILVMPVLFVQQLLRTGRRPGLRAPLLAGLLLALSGYQYWFYALFGGLLALAHGLFLLLRPDPGSSRLRVLGRHALMAVVALAVVAPVAVPLARAAATEGQVPGLLRVDLWSLSASPPVTAEGQTIGLFVWQPLKRWAGFHVLDTELTEHLLEQALLLPWLWLPLVLAFLWRPGPLRRGPMVAMGLTAMAIAAGSVIIVGDYALPNPIFIGLSKALGVMRRLWWPARALSYFTILLALATVVLLDQVRQRRGRLQQAVLAVLLTGAWAGELYAAGHVPFPAWEATIPAGYRCLATGPEGALVELPHSWTQAHLYYQTAHGRPIMGGMLENNPVFTPDELTELREDNEFIAALDTASRLGADAQPFAAEDAAAIGELGYRYVVLQKDAYVRPMSSSSRADNVQRTRLRRMQKGLRRMLGNPVYDDARLSIYAPWGGPAPCQAGDVEPDDHAVGLTELQADAMVRGGLQAQLLRRVWEAPLEDLVELETDEEASEEADTGAAQDTGSSEQDGGQGDTGEGASAPAVEQPAAQAGEQDQAPAQ